MRALFILVQNGIHFQVLITKHAMYLYKIICFVLFLNFLATIISSFLKFHILTFQICGKAWYAAGYRFWSPLLPILPKNLRQVEPTKNVAVARPCKNHLHVASFTFLCSWLLYLMYICNLYSILYKQMTKKKDTKNECNYPLPISRLAAAHCLRH